ncbi:Rhombotin-1 [Varanus komodoensis]|nr:Rhombotin-1 [Varanus komodoensis]
MDCSPPPHAAGPAAPHLAGTRSARPAPPPSSGAGVPMLSVQPKGKQKGCAGCNRKIKDRYLLKALDKYWHEDCLKCACCDCRLGEVGSTLYTKANLILCRRDYLRLFGTTGNCAACSKLIPAFEMVMRARDNVYHLDCFACQLCNQRFCVGDKFFLKNNMILCQMDYEEGQLNGSFEPQAYFCSLRSQRNTCWSFFSEHVDLLLCPRKGHLETFHGPWEIFPQRKGLCLSSLLFLPSPLVTRRKNSLTEQWRYRLRASSTAEANVEQWVAAPTEAFLPGAGEHVHQQLPLQSPCHGHGHLLLSGQSSSPPHLPPPAPIFPPACLPIH